MGLFSASKLAIYKVKTTGAYWKWEEMLNFPVNREIPIKAIFADQTNTTFDAHTFL